MRSLEETLNLLAQTYSWMQVQPSYDPVKGPVGWSVTVKRSDGQHYNMRAATLGEAADLLLLRFPPANTPRRKITIKR